MADLLYQKHLLSELRREEKRVAQAFRARMGSAQHGNDELEDSMKTLRELYDSFWEGSDLTFRERVALDVGLFVVCISLLASCVV